jgi:three-Cys-motif partner protein
LFPHLEAPKLTGSRVTFGRLKHPIWTENKAKLIERYLYYFVMITKHGTYIDGFAGPQNYDQLDGWAARLVLESEPRWLKNFFLCDSDLKKVEALEQLRANQPSRDMRKKEPKRAISIHSGDFNSVIEDVLKSGAITEKEATFCLLDQRTFECEWTTVERIARHKQRGQKIEIFYFLAVWWFARAFKETKDRSTIERWWGRKDWEAAGALSNQDRADELCRRFRGELGYRTATAWPIFERKNGGHIAYYMIHASDHGEAPKLMARAYRKAVTAKETPEQLKLELFGGKDVTTLSRERA